jgi:basic membrane protein A
MRQIVAGRIHSPAVAVRRLAVVMTLVCGLTTPAAGTADTAARLRVGYVTDAGALSDGAIGEHMYKGFVRGVRELGVDGRVLVVSPTRSADAALSELGRGRYDLIIAGGFIQAGAVNAAALRFPRSRFLYVLGPAGTLDPRLRNVRGLEIHAEQAGYLAGYLAALMEARRPGKDVVGAVGGFAQVPDVANYMGGYRRGARRADPTVAVLTGYSDDFVNPSKC